MMEPGDRAEERSVLSSVRHVPGNWVHPLSPEAVFGRQAPLEVDVGCGKGRFLLARAASRPDINYLGLERMLRRVRKVDRKAVRRGLFNIRLIRVEAYYAIAYLLPPSSVKVYYIFFPDPWPKKRHHDHRLFNPLFRTALHRTLRPAGVFHFASDHLPYGEEVAALFRHDPTWEETEPLVPTEEERTDFELLFRGQSIARCSFQRREAESPGL